MTLTSTGALTVNVDGTYTVTGTSFVTGLSYVTMTLVDHPAAPNIALTRKGTFVVIAVPKNNAPVICGGQP
jgi:hypothetical protein